MDRRSFLGSATGGIVATGALMASAHAGRKKENLKARDQILKSTRIVQVDDMSPIGYMATSPTRKAIRDHVAKYANNGVDVLVFCMANVDQCCFQSKVNETFPPRGGEGLGEPLETMIKHRIRNYWDMIDNGIDLPAVLAEAIHHNKMRFWPSMRLNTCNYETRIKREHPDWVLPMGRHVIPGCLDYEQEGIRSHVLAQARELVEDYDTDGLYLNFARYEGMFHPDRAYRNADLLTGWLGEIRSMLDEVAANKGKGYLPLAAQTLSRLPDGLTHGHDYRAWAQAGFVDYLCPGRENHIDFNLPMEQWMEAVTGTSCQIFPVLQPSLGYPMGDLKTQMTRDKFRAAVHNYYEAGATGLSSMNLIYVDDFNPLLLELRDRAKVAAGVHHYHFASPPYSSYDGNLNYGLEPNVMRQDYRFLIQTDLTQRRPGQIRVTLANVHPTDVIEIDLNRKLLPKYPQWGAVDSAQAYGAREGHRRIPVGNTQTNTVWGQGQEGARTYRYDASLADLPLRKGENSLGLRVVSRGVGVKASHPSFQGVEILV